MIDIWAPLFHACIGLLFGVLLGYTVCQGQAGLNKCQSTLPRNQHCILIAMPENNEVKK